VIESGARMAAMPLIDFRLQPVALLEKCGVSRRQRSNKVRESAPEAPFLNAGARHDLAVDEVVQGLVYPEAIHADVGSHSI
jgi:hypothetical protein